VDVGGVVVVVMVMMMMMVVVVLGAVQSGYWYSTFQYPVPCVTAPKRCPLATCSGDQDKHPFGKIRT